MPDLALPTAARSSRKATLAARLEVLEARPGTRHPPAEFLASPGTLGRVGMDDGAVAEDPAVHHQAREQPEVERHAIVAEAAEVLDELVARGPDAPRAMHQIPGELDSRVAARRQAPVEQHDATVAGEAE